MLARLRLLQRFSPRGQLGVGHLLGVDLLGHRLCACNELVGLLLDFGLKNGNPAHQFNFHLVRVRRQLALVQRDLLEFPLCQMQLRISRRQVSAQLGQPRHIDLALLARSRQLVGLGLQLLCQRLFARLRLGQRVLCLLEPLLSRRQITTQLGQRRCVDTDLFSLPCKIGSQARHHLGLLNTGLFRRGRLLTAVKENLFRLFLDLVHLQHQPLVLAFQGLDADLALADVLLLRQQIGLQDRGQRALKHQASQDRNMQSGWRLQGVAKQRVPTGRRRSGFERLKNIPVFGRRPIEGLGQQSGHLNIERRRRRLGQQGCRTVTGQSQCRKDRLRRFGVCIDQHQSLAKGRALTKHFAMQRQPVIRCHRARQHLPRGPVQPEDQGPVRRRRSQQLAGRRVNPRTPGAAAGRAEVAAILDGQSGHDNGSLCLHIAISSCFQGCTGTADGLIDRPWHRDPVN